MDFKSIGEVIRTLRKKNGMTGQQLAEKVGVSTAAVSKWENNLAYPDILLLPVLANIFDVSIDYLFSYGIKSEGEKMEKILKHFEEEAKEFDEIIRRLIPYYEQMIEAMIDVIPFEENQVIDVIDLGAGTGSIARAVKERFPNARITCLDFSSKMLEMAKVKLKPYSDISYILANFYQYQFDKKYDVVISSLALHHIVEDDDKRNFYKSIYDALKKQGVFYNLDVVLGSNEYLQSIYMNKWIEFMNKNCKKEEVENIWLPKYYEEDSPSTLMKHLEWLNNIGYREVDVILKYYNYSVYGGIK